MLQVLRSYSASRTISPKVLARSEEQLSGIIVQQACAAALTVRPVSLTCSWSCYSLVGVASP